MEGEPHEPAVSHETPIAEQDRLAHNDGDHGNVDGIAHVAIQTRHHEVLRRCDRRRSAQTLQGKARKRVNKPGQTRDDQQHSDNARRLQIEESR